jgi:phosphoribosylformimino-5-aminoimidazole carboxamide ribotide isomerase
MEILPAIDLLGGRCVRLIQGRYDRVIEYEDDPVAVAQRFRASGATWTHIIDLDGARQGEVHNLDAVRCIVRESGLKVQFGGGVRDDASIQAALDAGAQRVIVGTRALSDWVWFQNVAHRPQWSGKLALGLDARLGKLAVHGWTQETERSAVVVAESVTGWPLAAIVYTDIARDGLLLGPNLQAIRAMSAAAPLPVIASGGVTDLDDVKRLAELPLAGVVIGRALYEHALDLREALAIARQPR